AVQRCAELSAATVKPMPTCQKAEFPSTRLLSSGYRPGVEAERPREPGADPESGTKARFAMSPAQARSRAAARPKPLRIWQVKKNAWANTWHTLWRNEPTHRCKPGDVFYYR